MQRIHSLPWNICDLKMYLCFNCIKHTHTHTQKPLSLILEFKVKVTTEKHWANSIIISFISSKYSVLTTSCSISCHKSVPECIIMEGCCYIFCGTFGSWLSEQCINTALDSQFCPIKYITKQTLFDEQTGTRIRKRSPLIWKIHVKLYKTWK